MRNGPNWCKSSCHEVAPEFFIANTPDPPHWTLNWCFFVLYYLDAFGTFRCLTKLNAKRAELVQKFVPQSRILIFRNKHSWLTLLGPKLMFWCVSYYLGAFSTVWLPYKTRCKTGCSGAKLCAMKSCRNFSQRTYRVHPIRPQTDFLVRFVLFGCISAVWLPYETRCKTGRTSAKVRATKLCQNFSQRTCPIHPIGP